MDTHRTAPPEAASQEARHPGWLILAVVLLLIAYVPIGYLAPIFGLQFGWELVTERKSLWHQVWGAWLMVGTVIGNLQIVFCLISPSRPSLLWQNPFLKTAATLGQLSWGFLGFAFLPWYPWVIGSAILFTCTPGRFRWPNTTETWTQDWRHHRLLFPQPHGPTLGENVEERSHPLPRLASQAATPVSTGREPPGSAAPPRGG